jgi:hypothetical protein
MKMKQAPKVDSREPIGDSGMSALDPRPSTFD